jgi:hypothetical protein
MKRANLSKRAGSLVYGLGAVCAMAGVIFIFSGQLRVGSGLICAAIGLVVSTALERGDLKKW